MTLSAILLSLALAAPQPAAAEPPAFQELEWKIGECRFDRERLSFAGTPVQQAECLLRKVKRGGETVEQALPVALRDVLLHKARPSQDVRDKAIAALPDPFRTHATKYAEWPASRTQDNIPLAYFVIHDTSMPFLGHRRFPRYLDRDHEVNDFRPYFRDEPVAHLFLNRYGQIWGAHDISKPWRATKLESYVVGKSSRGRFVHVETVQPRRFGPGSTSRGDTIGPRPGFSDAQYEMLAALYIYASARAGRWLIPGFHANVDAGIPGAHDDPQNFELEKFGDALDAFLAD